jgi:hypothetical protein
MESIEKELESRGIEFSDENKLEGYVCLAQKLPGLLGDVFIKYSDQDLSSEEGLKWIRES